MRRGDIVLVSLDPVVGSEQGKVRPAVIVSSDAANSAAERAGRGVITVVPVTSNVAAVYPFQALLPPEDSGLARVGKAQAEQIRSISVQRVVRTIGAVSAERMADVDEALRLHLSL
jgi:mRNA interferase MazF